MTGILVVGLGNMGISHALAHHKLPNSNILALVNRSLPVLPDALQDYPFYTDFGKALHEVKPELVVIATYSHSHAEYAQLAMQAGAHVFVEKPLAATVADARSTVKLAKSLNKKLVVGYILRHHKCWQRLIKEAQNLGGPYVFRLNLNQQSSGGEWETHKRLLIDTSPIVDCGVHYVDVMCQIAHARPKWVCGIGSRLSDEINQDMYNYGQFQIAFDDGSVGWYEAGWGPMMSQCAHFIKDVISPKGSVSIIAENSLKSSEIEGHTKVGQLHIHHVNGQDRNIIFDSEPDHQELCDIEQQFVLDAINKDIDLRDHMRDAVDSLAICLAADESIRTNMIVKLDEEHP